ncbi:MAG TPA: radical SAM protein [Gemmatimonadaceae bacterium]
MRSGFLPARVVHVHPTRACNLACAHCYSESAPGIDDALDVERLIDLLARLREEGYEIVSVSGGEPLVYRPLDRLVDAAVELGFRVHMITNGLLLSERRLAALAGKLFLVGVSLDGSEETHNSVRGRPDAFRKAIRGLTTLSKSDTPFAVIYAVTAHSLADIPWAFQTARDLGARLLHLRPLVREGRARSLTDDWSLSAEDCSRLYVLAQLLSACGTGPRIQVDLVPVEELAEARAQFALLDPAARVANVSDAINPIVVDASGRCFPFAYGIDSRYELPLSIEDPHSPIAFDSEPWPSIVSLLDSALEASSIEGGEYVDWFAHLTRLSHRPSAVQQRTSRQAS